jgi:hypothetical protein
MSTVTVRGGQRSAEVPPGPRSLEVGDEGAGTASRSCFIAHLESSIRPTDRNVVSADTNHYWRRPYA